MAAAQNGPAQNGPAQNGPAQHAPMPLVSGAQRHGRRTDAAMSAFRRDRVGQFIHWGLYAIPAGSWNGVTYDFAAEFLPQSAGIPPEDWARLAERFDAARFDADEWARIAERMGARYVTVTTKHHDGFCLWPSAFTDFSVAATPLGRDVIGELVDAYTRRGIAVHLYYSVLDWRHPDWRYRIETADDERAFTRYLRFASDQLRELATRYPAVRGFWFDGTWDEAVKANGAWTLEVERMLGELIPGVIVNSRLRADENGARHRDSNGELMGDYFSGYERRLPDPWDRSVAADDWEACLTIPQNSWGYHAAPEVAATRKGPAELLEQLAQAVSLGGNVLLNFGPRGDGAFPDDDLAVADAVGAWLAGNGAAIYDCGPASGWDYPGWGFYTAPLGDAPSRAGIPGAAAETVPPADTVYAIITRMPVAGLLAPRIPAGLRLRAVTAVATGASVPFLVRDETSVAVPVTSSVERPGEGPLVLRLDLEEVSTAPPTREVNPDLMIPT